MEGLVLQIKDPRRPKTNRVPTQMPLNPLYLLTFDQLAIPVT